MMSLRSFASLLVVLSCWASVHARDLVVDNVSGSDLQNDRGKSSIPVSFGPYKTINRALLGAMPGDRIILTNTGEPYRECISLVGWKHSGSPGRPFEVIGNGATLDGSLAPTGARWIPVGNDVWELQQSPAGYGLLTSGGSLMSYTKLPHGNLADLAPLNWTRVGPRLFLRTEDGRGPFDYPLEVSDQTTGITLYDVRHVVIRDVVVRGYRIDGINVNDRCDDVSLLDVTVRQNGRSGLTLAGASNAKIGATLSEQNGDSQLRVEGRAVAYLGAVDLVEGMGQARTVVDAGRVEQLPNQ